MSSFSNLLSRLSFLNEQFKLGKPETKVLNPIIASLKHPTILDKKPANSYLKNLVKITALSRLDLITNEQFSILKRKAASVTYITNKLKEFGLYDKLFKDDATIDEVNNFVIDNARMLVGFAAKQMPGGGYDLPDEGLEPEEIAREVVQDLSQDIDDYSESFSDAYQIEIKFAKRTSEIVVTKVAELLKSITSNDDVIDIDETNGAIDIIVAKNTALDNRLDKAVKLNNPTQTFDQIERDIEGYIHSKANIDVVVQVMGPDKEAVSNLSNNGYEDEEMYGEEEAEDQTNQVGNWTIEELEGLGIIMPRYTGGKTPIEERSVLNYMSEQKVYNTPKLVVESQSFKDKFKPKTSKQLAELRNYGM